MDNQKLCPFCMIRGEKIAMNIAKGTTVTGEVYFCPKCMNYFRYTDGAFEFLNITFVDLEVDEIGYEPPER